MNNLISTIKTHETSNAFPMKGDRRVEDSSDKDSFERLATLERKWDSENQLMGLIVDRIDSLILKKEKLS